MLSWNANPGLPCNRVLAQPRMKTHGIEGANASSQTLLSADLPGNEEWTKSKPLLDTAMTKRWLKKSTKGTY